MNAEIDVSQVTLKTERLILRPWRQEDLDDLFEYASVPEIGEMAGWPPHTTKGGSQWVLNMFINEKKTFALEYNGKAIGSLGIEFYNEERFPELKEKKCREIGYALSKDYWGRGLMPEAVGEVIRYLFEEVGLDVIVCGHFLSNGQSARVQEKLGFKHHSFGQFELRDGSTKIDDEANTLTREDWEKRNQN